MKKRKKLIIIFTPLILLGLFFSTHMFINRPLKKIAISLPYAPENPPKGILPMGETLEHPNSPGGHPGLDFQWFENIPLISSIDGRVSHIGEHEDKDGTWDVRVEGGGYFITYKELQEYNPELKVGSEVKTGDFIGYPGHFFEDHYQLHWEFGTAKLMGGTRLCPVTYFDEESLKRINEEFSSQPSNEMLEQFPHICSGHYEGKNE